VVVVAPATAVAGAATTTHLRNKNIPPLLSALTAGVGTGDENIYPERVGFSPECDWIPSRWV
jgi:hypothetical protein